MSDAQTANTNVRPESLAERLLTPVQFVRGVGPQRAELLQGFIIEKMPKSPLHQYFVEKLRRILIGQIEPAATLLN